MNVIESHRVDDARDFAEAILYTTCEPLLVLTAELRVKTANPAFEDTFSLPRGEGVGQLIYELDGGQWDIPALRQLLDEVITTGRTFVGYEVTHEFERVGRRTMLLNARVLKNVRSCEHCVLLGMRDITERQEMERALAERARLLDLSNDAIILRDLNDRIQYWSKGAENIFGWTEAEVVGQDMHSLLRTEFPKPYQEIRERLLTTGFFSGEVVQRRRDGSSFYSLCRWVLDPRSSSILTSYTDINVVKEAEKAMREAQEKLAEHARRLEQEVWDRTARLNETVCELEVFSYSLVHDMRAPLRSMRSFANLLREEYGPRLDDEARSYIRRIMESAERMDAMIRDVLTFSRIGRGELPFATVHLDKLVHEIVEQYPHFQERKSCIRMESPLLDVYGNKALLSQCLSNLLENALKFVSPGATPEVTIRTEAVDDRVKLWVEDRGIGIPAASQGKIFGLFERLHRQEQYPGTGVGLAAVKKAVERMSGTVGVVSEAGKGSGFWIELPKAPNTAGDCP